MIELDETDDKAADLLLSIGALCLAILATAVIERMEKVISYLERKELI